MATKKLPKKNALRVRITDHELEKIESYAASRECTVSHIIREYIRRLPNSKRTVSNADLFKQLEQLEENYDINLHNCNIETEFEFPDFS